MGVRVRDRPVRWTSRKSISFLEVFGRIFVYARRVFLPNRVLLPFLESASPMVGPIGGPSSLLK